MGEYQLRAAVFVPPSPQDHVEALAAMTEGLEKSGVDVDIIPLGPDIIEKTHDFAVVFGVGKRAVMAGQWRGAVLSAYGKRALVIEKGYIKRDEYFSVGWGGLNGNADFCNFASQPNRWLKLGVELKPWQNNRDGHILICAQVPWDASVQDLNHIEWCRGTYHVLTASGKKVIFRPHPNVPDKSIYGIDRYSTRPLLHDLANANMVVTHNSNTGVDALIEGVPTVAFDKGSMVWQVAGDSLTSLENPITRDRTEWANDIAYAQWTLDEMESGETWKHIEKGLR